jgi:hypothetical protein
MLEDLVESHPLLDREIFEQNVDVREARRPEVLEGLLGSARPHQAPGGQHDEAVGELGVFQMVRDAKHRDVV